MSDARDFFSANGHRLTQGGLWCRGGEFNTIDPGEWERREFRILLARLSRYEDTSLSFTHNILYSLFADRGWFPDWSFLPPARDRELLADAGVPWLFGTQTKRFWRDFDVIGFANSISQEMGNLFWFLKNSGIPLSKRDRLADETIPLVILGGANSGSSSALFHADSPVDGIFTGEDFGMIAGLFSRIRSGRADGLPKREILDSLASVDGFFEPDRPRSVRKFNSRSLEVSALYARMPLNWGEGNAGKAVLAISEGCAGFCSFCNESFARKPYREAPVAALLAEARALKSETGADKIDLFSFNFNMHRDFYALVDGLVPLFREIGLKSQRFDGIAEDPSIVEVEKALGKSVFTCGLEGVSERMRAFLNKNLSESQVRRSMETLVAASVREIKVFLIATARETPDDHAEWARFLSWVAGLRTPQGKQVRIVFSVTPLVRFPHTPLEFEQAPTLELARAAMGKIVETTERAGFECRAAASAEEALWCDRLLRADRPEVFEAFRAAVLESGFVYEREIPASLYRIFAEKLSAAGERAAAASSGFSPERNASAPWAALDLGVSRAYLERQYARNSAYSQAEPDAALLCGSSRQKLSPVMLEALKSRVALARKDEFPVAIPCEVGSRWRGVSREYPALGLARALMRAEPALVVSYRGFASSYWQAEASAPVYLAGADVLTLRFSREGAVLLSARGKEFWERVNELAASDSLRVFGPGDSDRFECELLARSPFDVNPSFLASRGLKHVYERDDDGSFAYRLTKDAVKKNILRSLSVDKREPGIFSVRAVPGPKFELSVFLREGFRCDGKDGWRRIEINSRRLGGGEVSP